MNRQGQRTDLTFSPLDKKLRSGQELASNAGDSQAQIYRYIRLTELIPALLTMVDEGRIALRPAVELSYLGKLEQQDLAAAIGLSLATPSHAQAIKLRTFSKEGKLSPAVIESIMCEEKPNQKEKINIQYAEARKYIPSSVPYEQTGAYILKALEYYHRHLERQRNDAKVKKQPRQGSSLHIFRSRYCLSSPSHTLPPVNLAVYRLKERYTGRISQVRRQH